MAQTHQNWPPLKKRLAKSHDAQDGLLTKINDQFMRERKAKKRNILHKFVTNC